MSAVRLSPRAQIARLALVALVSFALLLAGLVALPQAARAAGEPATFVPNVNGMVMCHGAAGMYDMRGVGYTETCAALTRLEDRITDQIATIRSLSAPRQVTRAAARPANQAAMWLEILTMAKKPAASRTADETTIVTWLTAVWKAYRGRLVSAAFAEYSKWTGSFNGKPNLCTYVPPEPYQSQYPTNGIRWSGCYERGGGIGTLFSSGPEKPSAAQFLTWGSAVVSTELSYTLPMAAQVQANMLALLSGPGAGVVATGSFLSWLKVADYSTVKSIFKGLDDYKNLEIDLEGKTKIIKNVVRIAKFLKYAGLIFSVVSFVVEAIVTQAMKVFAPDPFTGLQNAADAERAATYNLTDVVGDANSTTVLLQLWLGSLNPNEVSVLPAIPDRVESDAAFVVSPELPAATPQTTLSLATPSGSPVTVQMRSGFFSVTTAGDTPTLRTTISALDGDGKGIVLSQLRREGRWVWSVVPTGGQSGICGTTGPNCPVTASTKLTLANGTVATVNIVDPEPVATTFTGPISTTDNSDVSYTLRLANGLPLTDLRWEGKRDLGVPANGSVAADPCQPGTGALFTPIRWDPDRGEFVNEVFPSVYANTPLCSVAGSGQTFTTRLGGSGSWKVTGTGKLADGTVISRTLIVDVAKTGPQLTLDQTYCGLDGQPVGCQSAYVFEDDILRVDATLKGDPTRPYTLSLMRGAEVVATVSVPCRSAETDPRVPTNFNFYFFSQGQSYQNCISGFTAEPVMDDGVRTGTWDLVWRLYKNEPFTGALRIVAADDDASTDDLVVSLGNQAGWVNVPPTSASFLPPLPVSVKARTRLDLSEVITDLGGTTDLTVVSASVDGRAVALPNLTRLNAAQWRYDWSGTFPQSPTNTAYRATLLLKFRDPQGGIGTFERNVFVQPVTDTTPPVVTVSPPIPASGWYNATHQALTWTATDPESDVVLPARCNDFIAFDSEPRSYSCTANSVGGSTTLTHTWKRDATPPRIAAVGGPQEGLTYDVGGVPAAPTCTATDAFSGVFGECTVSGYSTAPGDHVITLRAADVAGNVATSLVTYTVAGEPTDAPVITPKITGTPGINGWWISRFIGVEWTVVDDDDAITSTTGCAPRTLSQLIEPLELTCTATSSGGTTTRRVVVKQAYGTSFAFLQGGPELRQSYPVSAVPPPPTGCTGFAPRPNPTCVVLGGYSTAVGEHEISFELTDEAGNVYSDHYGYSVYDDTDPIVTPTLQGDLDQGWYTSNVTVSWAASDPDSALTASSGCDAVVVDTDTAGRTFTCTATSDGGTTTQSVTLKRDASGPSVVGVGAPTDGGTYVTGSLPSEAPTCTATDAGIGVDGGCQVLGFVDAIGTQTLTMVATDLLGNRTAQEVTYTVTGPDSSGPDVAEVLDGDLAPTGWFRGDVAVSWTVGDLESAVSSTTGCDPVTVDADVLETELTCTATSAGGQTSRTAVVRRDATAPVIEIFGGPQDGASYLAKDLPAAPVCTAQDDTSGLVEGGCVVTGYSPEAGDQTITFRAQDVAGNVTSRSVAYTVIPDTTAPTLAPTVEGPLGDDGWYTGDVVVDFHPADPESEVTRQEGCGPFTVDADTTGQTFDCFVVSAGGEADTQVTVKRDATAPALTVTGGPTDGAAYDFGSVPAQPECSATDATSGLIPEGAPAGCTVTGWSAAVGAHTITVTATDRAGNVATRTVGYTVGAVVPGAPTAVTAVPGDRSASVSWTAPDADGGSPVTGYVVTATAPGRPTVTVEVPGTSTTLTGLEVGATYTVAVVARSSAGDSAPGTTTVVPGRAPALSGTAPAGVAGQGYSYTYARTGFPFAPVVLAGGALPPGLSLTPNGQLSGTPTKAGSFTFRLTAANGIGAPAELNQLVTVVAGSASAISTASGAGQTALLGTAFPTRLGALVTDAYGNPVAGRQVLFTAPATLGRFARGATVTAVTGANGVALAPQLTATASVSSGVVTAQVVGTSLPATGFTLGAVTSTSPANLRVSVSGPAELARNGSATVTVTVTNVGPSRAYGVVPVLTVGSGLTAVAPASAGSVVRPRYVVGPRGELASGATSTWTVTVKAWNLAQTSSLAAAVASTRRDPSPVNNVASVPVTVR